MSLLPEVMKFFEGILLSNGRKRGEVVFDVPIGTIVEYFNYAHVEAQILSKEPSKWKIDIRAESNLIQDNIGTPSIPTPPIVNNSASGHESSEQTEPMRIGDTIEIELGLYLTINSARVDGSGSGLHLIFDCTFENGTGSDYTINSRLSLSITDLDGNIYRATPESTLNGTVSHGYYFNGEVGFEVPPHTAVEWFLYEPLQNLDGFGVSRWRIALNVRPNDWNP
jgi:hypothetical protein